MADGTNNHVSNRSTSAPIPKRRQSTYPLTSFNNLVSLANAQERWNKGLESSKKFVWRDAGASPVVLESLLDCLKHGAAGGLRAAALAYGIRAGINLCLIVFRKFRFALIRHALFGPEARRFGAMIGTFTALYKFLLNALPILVHRWQVARERQVSPVWDADLEDQSPSMSRTLSALPKWAKFTLDFSTPPTPSGTQAIKPPHLSSTTQASLQLARERGYNYKPWHAALAGTLAGGLAVLLERPNNRSAVGQQMITRGIQGLYNVWSRKTGVVVPFGSVIVFSLCCGQIIYSFLLNPHTLSPAYDAWISSMSNAPLESVRINRSLVHTGKYDVKLLETILEGRSKPWKGADSIITPRARAGMLEELDRVRKGIFGPRIVACEIIHPHRDSCTGNVFMKIWECARLLLPVYGALHFIPVLLFKRKALLKNPLHAAARALLGTIRSSTFIGVFVAILQGEDRFPSSVAVTNLSFAVGFCTLRNLQLANLPPPYAELLKRLSASKLFWWFMSSLTGLSLLIENKHRREELAMYVLPKAGESAWVTFREEFLGIKSRRKGAWKADAALSAAGMGLVMTIYQTEPAALSGLVRRVLYQFIGPN